MSEKTVAELMAQIWDYGLACSQHHESARERGIAIEQAIRRAVDSAALSAEPAQEMTDETKAYAEGRGDQFADDCAVVRLLFDNLNDVDVMEDGRINTTRVRELLSHFDVPAPVECSGLECTRAECSALGCLADRINTEREKAIDAAIAKGERHE